jgi:hypothetical protein
MRDHRAVMCPVGDNAGRRQKAKTAPSRAPSTTTVQTTVTLSPPLRSAVAGGWFGLYCASDFVIATGRDHNLGAIPQALWYFENETIALPRAGLPVAGFARSATAAQDIARWADTHPRGSARLSAAGVDRGTEVITPD